MLSNKIKHLIDQTSKSKINKKIKNKSMIFFVAMIVIIKKYDYSNKANYNQTITNYYL